MRGFTKNKYKRIMDKLYFNRPMHRVSMFVRTTTQAPHNQLIIASVPCMVNILSSSAVWIPTHNYHEISNKIEIIIHSSYFKDKKFPDNQTLLIPKILADKNNGGYASTTFSISPKTTDGQNTGYIYSDLQVTYGEYEDGGYGEYIKFVIIRNQVLV